jgi:hypothetical protein
MAGRKNQLMMVNPINNKAERREHHPGRKPMKLPLGTQIRITPE